MKPGKTSYHPCGPQRSGNRPWPAPGAAGSSGHSAPCHSWKEISLGQPGHTGTRFLGSCGQSAPGFRAEGLSAAGQSCAGTARSPGPAAALPPTAGSRPWCYRGRSVPAPTRQLPAAARGNGPAPPTPVRRPSPRALPAPERPRSLPPARRSEAAPLGERPSPAGPGR